MKTSRRDDMHQFSVLVSIKIIHIKINRAL